MSNSELLKNRRSTSFSLSFPTAPSFKAQPQRVHLYQEPGKHDILEINFQKSSSAWFRVLKTGTPVTFSWTQGRLKNTWVGYVYQISKQNIGQRETPLQIVCLGASFVLKQKSREVFKNKTIPEIASLIAKKFHLQFEGVQHARRFSHVSLNGQSYWAWLQENAKKIGYVAYVENSKLVFKPFDSAINANIKNSVPFNHTAGALPINNMVLDRTLDSLTVYNGDYNEGSDSNRSVKISGGIDPVTGKILSASVSPKNTGAQIRQTVKGVIFDEYNVTQVVNDFTSVETAAKGAAELARFNVPAKAVGQGDPRVRPYYPVKIYGTGELTDGTWVALKVHHMFHRVGDYQVEMALATDGLGPDAPSPFRMSEESGAGIINVDTILLAASTTTAVEIHTVLTTPGVLWNEQNQGFASNPSVWKSKRYTGQGCCP